jgi:putative ABC transport system substrate-binding protein
MRFHRLKRREFIAMVGGAMAWPLAAHAQQRTRPVVGFLRSTSRDDSVRLVLAFQQGLKLGGYFDGQNLEIEYRWADNQADRQPALVADLVTRNVDVIVANQGSAAAVMAANKTIPFVFVIGGDPIRLGLVPSLSRPGGNVTGLTFLQETVVAKQLELMHEVVPQEKSFAVLLHTATPGTDLMLKDLQGAARVMGVELRPARVDDERDFETAFATLGQEKVGALVVPGGAFLLSRRNQIVQLAARHRIPTIYSDREEVVAGGLLSYGPSQTEAYRGAGVYVSKILKGAKPADLPVDESTKFELVVNLQTAKSLGIEMPLSLLMRVSEAIE